MNGTLKSGRRLSRDNSSSSNSNDSQQSYAGSDKETQEHHRDNSRPNYSNGQQRFSYSSSPRRQRLTHFQRHSHSHVWSEDNSENGNESHEADEQDNENIINDVQFYMNPHTKPDEGIENEVIEELEPPDTSLESSSPIPEPDEQGPASVNRSNRFAGESAHELINEVLLNDDAIEVIDETDDVKRTEEVRFRFAALDEELDIPEEEGTMSLEDNIGENGARPEPTQRRQLGLPAQATVIQLHETVPVKTATTSNRESPMAAKKPSAALDEAAPTKKRRKRLEESLQRGLDIFRPPLQKQSAMTVDSPATVDTNGGGERRKKPPLPVEAQPTELRKLPALERRKIREKRRPKKKEQNHSSGIGTSISEPNLTKLDLASKPPVPYKYQNGFVKTKSVSDLQEHQAKSEKPKKKQGLLSNLASKAVPSKQRKLSKAAPVQEQKRQRSSPRRAPIKPDKIPLDSEDISPILPSKVSRPPHRDDSASPRYAARSNRRPTESYNTSDKTSKSPPLINRSEPRHRSRSPPMRSRLETKNRSRTLPPLPRIRKLERFQSSSTTDTVRSSQRFATSRDAIGQRRKELSPEKKKDSTAPDMTKAKTKTAALQDEIGFAHIVRPSTILESDGRNGSDSDKELRRNLEEIHRIVNHGTSEAVVDADSKQQPGGDENATKSSPASSKSGSNEELKSESASKSKLVFVPKRDSSKEASLEPGITEAALALVEEIVAESKAAEEEAAAAAAKGEEPGTDQEKDKQQQQQEPVFNEELSKKLVLFCHKNEWAAVDSLLRPMKPKEVNFAVADETGLTPLMMAVKENKLAIVERMLELGANVNDLTIDGLNAAHIAALHSKEEILRALVARKVDLTSGGGENRQLPLHMACTRPAPNALSVVQTLLRTTRMVDGNDVRLVEDRNGHIPVMLACEAGNTTVVKDLLMIDGDQQTQKKRQKTGDTALHIACRKRDIEVVRAVLQHCGDVDIQNADGQTALHIVATNGDEPLLRLFFQAKANANIADKLDRTPLHLATEQGNTLMVEILIDKFKANLNARTKDGSTLMHLASQHGYPETALAFLKRGVPLMMPNKTGSLGLHMAAAQGHLQVVKTLLQKGTNVDSKTKQNYTALHVAVQAGHPLVVECLLGFGADVHVRGGENLETALHIAAGKTGPDGVQCAEMLVKSGAEVNVAQENGETALHVAARTGSPAMVKLLLSEGADPMQTSKSGETSSHVAVRYCHYQVLKQMIDHMIEKSGRKEDATALINLPNNEAETAVHYAAEVDKNMCHYIGEDVDIIRTVLEFGGEVNVPTALTQETAMHYCARAGNDAVLAQIVNIIGPGQVQIALNKQSKSGWSPLLEACERGHLSVVKILLHHHARVDVFDEHGKTGLHLAAENGHAEVCDALLSHKAFVNSKTKSGVTPLHLCAMNGHERVVQLLINQHKAAIDALSLDNRTPLHVAAQNGQIHVCSILLALGANPNAKDSKGQSPLHLAAEADFPDVVKLFLKMKPDLSTLTATDENGYTCAHIAAMKGSVAVVKQLMQIDKDNVINAATKGSESTALHLAAGGHQHVVKVLLEAGANAMSENANGMTALHLAARYGHYNVLDVIDHKLWGYCSKKIGLTSLHVGAHFGQLEFVRHMLTDVPATVRSEPPATSNPLMVKELANDYALTPLHLAAQSGHEGLVRLLLNFQGVQVDAQSALQGVIPLHLAAQCGHIAVVGLLLSRSTHQLHIKDSRSRTALHLAAYNGHTDMCALLLGQGSNINATDQYGWTALHFATKAGHLDVVKLLLESSGDPMAETKEGKVALCYAAEANQPECLSYLMNHPHDTYMLLEDRKFVFHLMICAKTHNFKPIEEFVLLSPAPIDTAVKLSAIYRDMASKEKERAKDLLMMCEYVEDIAADLMSIVSTDYNAAMLLKSLDNRSRQFLDVLIENQQKRVISHISVQQYLTQIWNGGIAWGFWRFLLFFLVLIVCPPLWIAFSLPLRNKICRAPVVRFICHLISHIYFTAILFVQVLQVYEKVYEHETVFPNIVEWILVLWLSGILVSELGNPAQRSITRIVTLVFSAIAIILHLAAFFWPQFVDPALRLEDEDNPNKFTHTLMYVKNQFFALAALLCFIQFLDYLTVHHLFGPWAIIISSLLYDLMRFLVILALFMVGFTIVVACIFKPAYKAEDTSQVALEDPVEVLDMLFFALFGLTDPDQMPPLTRTPAFSNAFLKVAFAVYLMIGNVVLINLLIAMMSATYERIEAQSDIEWKFGRAKLIRQMNKKSAIPAPINIMTKFFTVIKVAINNKCNLFSSQAQEAMRFEENIDSYSMKDGRHSPAFEKKLDTDDTVLLGHGRHVEEAGRSMNIESVIDWQRVLESYRRFQGITVLGERMGQENLRARYTGAVLPERVAKGL